MRPSRVQLELKAISSNIALGRKCVFNNSDRHEKVSQLLGRNIKTASFGFVIVLESSNHSYKIKKNAGKTDVSTYYPLDVERRPRGNNFVHEVTIKRRFCSRKLSFES